MWVPLPLVPLPEAVARPGSSQRPGKTRVPRGWGSCLGPVCAGLKLVSPRQLDTPLAGTTCLALRDARMEGSARGHLLWSTPAGLDTRLWVQLPTWRPAMVRVNPQSRSQSQGSAQACAALGDAGAARQPVGSPENKALSSWPRTCLCCGSSGRDSEPPFPESGHPRGSVEPATMVQRQVP